VSIAVVVSLIALFALFWFVFVVPQRRRQRRQVEELLELIELLEPGDEIITAGGIHGTVRAVMEDELLVEVAPGVDVRLDRRAVAAVNIHEDAAEEPEDEGEEPEEPVAHGDSGGAVGR
jgi:preprotein translocase subunit YajC